MSSRMRADRLLVERGLFESRAKAQAAIEAGLVTADSVRVRRAAEEIACDARLEAEPAHPWVSRGGVKLAHALDALRYDVAGCVCLDVGASTGGFTDVLLARGAARVYAVDVGSGQLHARLRTHPRVASLERTDIRALERARLDPAPSLATVDVSFISLKAVLPSVVALMRPPARLVALVKPQFEVGRAHLKKGIVRDAALQEAACEEIAACLRALGLTVAKILPSPIRGGDGNAEFFIGAARD
ncbi:MAG: TlyA family RNA methyltransferase [Variibacter sp.]|nr:TlyA family RNA methyltransferase [Variibacter sp.]